MEKAREARAAKDAERIKSEKARKAKEARDASKSSKQANLNTPEGIKETLLNIVRGANKVTEEDKKVIENYLQGILPFPCVPFFLYIVTCYMQVERILTLRLPT